MSNSTLRSVVFGAGVIAAAAVLALVVNINKADAEPSDAARTRVTATNDDNISYPDKYVDGRAQESWCSNKEIGKLKRACQSYRKCSTRPKSQSYLCLYKRNKELGEIPMYKNKGDWGSGCRKVVRNINKYCN